MHFATVFVLIIRVYTPDQTKKNPDLTYMLDQTDMSDQTAYIQIIQVLKIIYISQQRYCVFDSFSTIRLLFLFVKQYSHKTEFIALFI